MQALSLDLRERTATNSHALTRHTPSKPGRRFKGVGEKGKSKKGKKRGR